VVGRALVLLVLLVPAPVGAQRVIHGCEVMPPTHGYGELVDEGCVEVENPTRSARTDRAESLEVRETEVGAPLAPLVLQRPKGQAHRAGFAPVATRVPHTQRIVLRDGSREVVIERPGFVFRPLRDPWY
jgi:hypothetical protein